MIILLLSLLCFLQNHLSGTDHAFVPISVVSEGKESTEFKNSF